MIIVHKSKFRAPVVESILKYIRYADTEHITTNKIEYWIEIKFKYWISFPKQTTKKGVNIIVLVVNI